MHRWVIRSSPQLEEAFHRRQPPVWLSGRMAETSMQVQGQWRSRSRAVDKQGPPIAFRRTAPRENEAARRCLKKARRRHGLPEPLPLDGRQAHAAASTSDNAAHGPPILSRQVNYLHHMVEPEHRGVKRVTRPR